MKKYKKIMIRVCLLRNNAYGTDVTGWEYHGARNYDNYLDEDLLERVEQGDVVMYFDTNESAENWCSEHMFEYEFLENDDN